MANNWARTKQVALLIETSNAYARGLLRGIVGCIREHRPWSLYLAEHFQRAVEAEGGPCIHYQPARRFPRDDVAHIESLARWLRKLPKPIGIATRQSTDVFAVEDRSIAMAMRFIRDQACEGINMKDVLRAAPQSRRRLETRFQRHFGRTPHEEVLRVQLARAKQLLLQSDLPLPDIAERAGFKHGEYFSVVFKKHVGMPPSQYRSRNRV